MSLPLPTALLFITLQAPGGQPVFVSPHGVSSVREPQNVNKRYFVKGTRCVLVMTNGQFIAVTETCDEVLGKLQEKE